jgi:proteic killer suppression protein
MIKSWKNSATRQLAEGGKSKFSVLDVDAALDLVYALHRARSLDALSPLKSVGLHKLKGGRKGQWAMTINGRWRLVFEFRDGDAYDVEVTDYH